MAGKIEKAELALTESVAQTQTALAALDRVVDGEENAGVLPEGWKEVALEEFALVNMGQSPKGDTVTLGGDGLPFYQGKTEFGKLHPRPRKYCTAPTKLAEQDDILLSVRAPVGPTNICQETSCIGRGLAGVRSYERKSQNYLHKFFLNVEPWLSLQGTGTTFKAISGGFLRDIKIPLPPLAEQTVIAQTLDTLLAQVDNIKTRLDAIPKILKTFRQSVLAAAVSGKLTEEWRGESVGYSSASLNGGSWGDLPNNWQVKAYKEVVDSRLGKMLDKAKNSGIPTKYLGNINVRWFSIDLEKTQEILVSEDEISELSLKIGDVLICEGGEPGRCAIWKQEQSEAIVFQKALHRARVSSDLIPEWLLYNLKNDADNLFLEQLFTGTTIKHLTGKALAKYPLRLPPVKEQTEIVRRVEELFAFADQIEQQVKNAQGRVNNLTQSVLAKAFRGELTTQWRAENPNLISGDNSAEALLAKIKEERENLKPKKSVKNKSNAKTE